MCKNDTLLTVKRPGINGGTVPSGKSGLNKDTACSVIPCYIKNYIPFDFIRFFLNFFSSWHKYCYMKGAG
jgi:hypothetical protein